jgi:hypothetical protein
MEDAKNKHPVRLAYQPPARVLFSHNKPATNNQPAVLFSQNKPAPAISHQPTEQAEEWGSIDWFETKITNEMIEKQMGLHDS